MGCPHSLQPHRKATPGGGLGSPWWSVTSVVAPTHLWVTCLTPETRGVYLCSGGPKDLALWGYHSTTWSLWPLREVHAICSFGGIPGFPVCTPTLAPEVVSRKSLGSEPLSTALGDSGPYHGMRSIHFGCLRFCFLINTLGIKCVCSLNSKRSK